MLDHLYDLFAYQPCHEEMTNFESEETIVVLLSYDSSSQLVLNSNPKQTLEL